MKYLGVKLNGVSMLNCNLGEGFGGRGGLNNNVRFVMPMDS